MKKNRRYSLWWLYMIVLMVYYYRIRFCITWTILGIVDTSDLRVCQVAFLLYTCTCIVEPSYKWVFLVLAFTLLWQQLRQNPASKASQKGHRNRCCLKNKMTVRFYICWTFSWLFIYPTAKIAENQKRPTWIGRERICWAIIICPWVRLRVAYKTENPY